MGMACYNFEDYTYLYVTTSPILLMEVDVGIDDYRWKSRTAARRNGRCLALTKRNEVHPASSESSLGR